MRDTIFYLCCAALLAVASPLPAATYYVATNGSDSYVGTNIAQPWKTIQKAANTLVAGDTANIGSGDYDEHVYETTSGSSGNYITYQAAEPHMASLRAFRLGGQYIRISGLKLTKFSGAGYTWGSAIRVEANSHNCIITNCWISDSPYIITNDFRFNYTNNEVISPSSDFSAVGFKPGSQVYLGASGLYPLYYSNHDTVWVVASNTATSLWLTNADKDSFVQDDGSNYWAAVRPGGDASGFYGIYFVISGGEAATNVLISHNVVSNWIGSAISISGRGHVFENNYMTRLLSFKAIQFDGSDHIIRSNVVKYSPNILHYSGDDMTHITHPAGSGWYDYVTTVFASFALTPGVRTNNLLDHNWFEDIENQLGRLDDEQVDTYGVNLYNNVFIGISTHFSGGRDAMHWVSNTFYRCAYGSSSPLQIGGRPPQQTNYIVTHNLFVECGPLNRNDIVGYYGVDANALNPLIDSNMVAGAEIMGFSAKGNFSETNGINGGDPGFVNALQPMGPDGVPFTADDGLKVLPSSPAARIGGGALGVYQITTNYPVAHFRVISPQGWFEATGTNYNSSWWTNRPYKRSGTVRPWNTPQTLGLAPVSVTFSADSSISGVGDLFTNTGITNYTWDFGDKTTATSSEPLISHQFLWRGERILREDRIVKLTVQNLAGNTHTFSNIYRIKGPEQPGGGGWVPPTNLMVTPHTTQ